MAYDILVIALKHRKLWEKYR